MEIISAFFREGHVPNSMKGTTIVSPVVKKLIFGEHSNYCPVSNLPVLGKIIENVVTAKLQNVRSATGSLTISVQTRAEHKDDSSDTER